MNDNELFELCRKVAKRTDWLCDEDASDYYFYWESNERGKFSVRHKTECPYYSKDEKLPPTIVARGVEFSTATRIAATSKQLIGTESDTPLKALLKLTVALDDVGELSRA
jgi:hypothetical protein